MAKARSHSPVSVPQDKPEVPPRGSCGGAVNPIDFMNILSEGSTEPLGFRKSTLNARTISAGLEMLQLKADSKKDADR